MKYIRTFNPARKKKRKKKKKKKKTGKRKKTKLEGGNALNLY